MNPTQYELLVRQECANLIQVLGIKLHMHQLYINTAITYFHRFLTADPTNATVHFSPYEVAVAAFFIAAKIDSLDTRLKQILGEYYSYFGGEIDYYDSGCAQVTEQIRNVIRIERIMMPALKFDLTIEQPHTILTDFLLPIERDNQLRHTACVLATISLHLTVACLKYTPGQIACVCIYLASKVANCAIPSGRTNWFCEIDSSLTIEALRRMAAEFTGVSRDQLDDFDSAVCRACYRDTLLKRVWMKLRKMVLSARTNGKRKADDRFESRVVLHPAKSARRN